MHGDSDIITTLLAQILNISNAELSEIKEDDSLRERGLNSVRGIELIVNLEREFNICINDEDLMIGKYDTIGKLRKLVEKYTEGM